MVVDDYGHHPTEIRATLAAAKQGWKRRLVVLFQPHRYTRTRDLFEEFTRAFDQADVVFVTDIYPAGEAEIPGVSGRNTGGAIRAAGHPPSHGRGERTSWPSEPDRMLQSGDMVITLGAGDIWKVGTRIVGASVMEVGLMPSRSPSARSGSALNEPTDNRNRVPPAVTAGLKGRYDSMRR